MSEKVTCLVAWHNETQRSKFCEAWVVKNNDPRVHFQQDVNHEGCAATKNRAIDWAVDNGVDVAIILDDDVAPHPETGTLDALMAAHVEALKPQPIDMFLAVTAPASRGTPYFEKNRKVVMPVAASMGYWTNIPDYDACGQLVYGPFHPMDYTRDTVYGQYFSLCGMNLAFRVKEWWPWCEFVGVNRFDDIFCGLLWQKEAYRRKCCFNLAGPLVKHSRQSNVFANLRDEAKYLEQNETLWREIFLSDKTGYEDLVKLLPHKKEKA